jgi:hypothetical protein
MFLNTRANLYLKAELITKVMHAKTGYIALLHLFTFVSSFVQQVAILILWIHRIHFTPGG